MADKAEVYVICGPTATGKTRLSVEVAKRLNAEIISADSMQIYKELSVGTAKVTQEETQGIKHHLVDFLHPSEVFSVAQYVKLAAECIDDIVKRGKTPLIVGGTGLYIDSLLKGVAFEEKKTDMSVRKKLQDMLGAKGADAMYAMLCEVDPIYAQNVHKNNTVRVLRALELYMQTGKTMTQQIENSLPADSPYNHKIAAVTCTPRQLLYDRINTRIDAMVNDGLLDEAKMVHENKERYITAAQAIGYKEFFGYFEGEQTLEASAESLKQATRNYAKRQLTWFNRNKQIVWYNALSDSLVSDVCDYFTR